MNPPDSFSGRIGPVQAGIIRVPLYQDQPGSIQAMAAEIMKDLTAHSAAPAGGTAEAPPVGSAPTVQELCQKLGISMDDWSKYNPDVVLPEESAVASFGAGQPTAAALKEWTEFAKKLIELGMAPQAAMQSDYLFFDLVRAPRSSSYEREQPGRHGAGSIDIEKAQKALKDVLGLDDASPDPAEREEAGAVMEALWILDSMLNGMWKGSGFEHVPFQPPLAEMLRASKFVSRAHSGGVYDGRERNLFELFFEYRKARAG